jgi:hypothetical protein
MSVFNPMNADIGNYATIPYVNKTFLKSHYPNIDTPATFQNGGSIVMNENDNLYAVTIKAPTTGLSSYNFVLPTTSGTSNQVLTTDGSGTTSWSNGGSGGSSFTVNHTMSASTINSY